MGHVSRNLSLIRVLDGCPTVIPSIQLFEFSILDLSHLHHVKYILIEWYRCIKHKINYSMFIFSWYHSGTRKLHLGYK